MSNISKRLPTLTFWTAFAMSIINIIATIIGFNVAIQWLIHGSNHRRMRSATKIKK